MKLIHWRLAVGGWAVTFGTARGLGSLPKSLLAVPNVTAHPLTASVPIILYNGLLLCGFNVHSKGLIRRVATGRASGIKSRRLLFICSPSVCRSCNTVLPANYTIGLPANYTIPTRTS